MPRGTAFSIIFLGFAASTQALAEDDTVIMGSNEWTGGEGPGDAEAMDEIRAAAAALRQSVEQNRIDRLQQ